MSKYKHKLSVTLDPDLVKRVERIAKGSNRSRSATIEQLIRQGVEDAETAVQAFTDPVILQAFAGAMGNRDVLRAVASAVHEEMTDQQLDLFVKGLEGLGRVASESGLSPGKDLERVAKATRGSGQRQKAKPPSQ